MKTYIASTHFNSIFIETQKKSIDKFFKGECEYFVFNDARYDSERDKINRICDELSIKHINIHQDIHNDRRKLFPETIEPHRNIDNTRASDSVQIAHNYFLENFSDCYNLIIDSDMFFIKNFDINSYMKDYNVASIIIDILPKLGHRLSPGFGLDSYFWNGVCIFKPDELKNLNELNWDCGRVNGNPVDTGGQTNRYINLYKDHIKLKNISWKRIEYREEINNFDLDDDLKSFILKFEAVRKRINKEILLDDSLLHIRSGCGWDGSPEEYFKNCVKIYNQTYMEE